ncbi:MAG: prepilin-type N-terminal cleavage/methylation domain-containing protein [Candidatus Omnitrophota bacterium]
MKKNRQGFTLVEIMIVVAIIALLAVIAIPNLMRARVSANDALAQSTLRTLATAVQNFAADNNGTFPADLGVLATATPPYTNVNYATNATQSGFTYAYVAATNTITATPATCGTTGSRVFTINTQSAAITAVVCS